MSWTAGDLFPPAEVQLVNGDPVTGPVVPLTGATSVALKMRTVGGPTLVLPMSISDTVHGIVIHNWLQGETDVAGTYKCQVVVTWAGGVAQTFPQGQQDWFYIVIEEAL